MSLPVVEEEKTQIREESAGDIASRNGNSVLPGRSKRPFYYALVILAVAGIISLSYWLYTRQFVTTDDAYIEGNIVQVSPKITANVSRILVKENQYVKKGDLLIELDSREAEVKLLDAKAKLTAAEADKAKAISNARLTKKMANAELTEARSNFDTAKLGVGQSKLQADSKESAISQAEAQVKTAEAAHRQVQSQIPAAKAAIEQAKARVPMTESRLEYARNEYERAKSLFADGHISRSELERTNASLSEAIANNQNAVKQIDIANSQLNSLNQQVEIAASRVREAKESVNQAENAYRQSAGQINEASSRTNESLGRLQNAEAAPERIAVGESEIANADAQIAQAQAAVSQAELELSYTKIYAPEEGYVTRKAVQEGQLVQPEEALMALSRPGIWIVANFKETQIDKIRAGQQVDIYVDAYPNVSFHGTVDSFQAGTGSRFSVLPPENASGNYVKVVQRIPVKIVLEETPEKVNLLVPGMSVTPKIKVR